MTEIENDLLLMSDDEKLSELKEKKYNQEQKIILVKSMLNDEKKVEALNLFGDNEEHAKKEIILTLKSDENKIKAIEKHIKNPYNQVEIIKGFSNEENKVKAARIISKEFAKVRICISLEEDNNKLELLKEIKKETYKTAVIKSFESNKTKIEQLELLKDEVNKAKVIISISNDELKIELLKKLKSEFTKTLVIANLKSDETKINQLKKIRGENAKANIIRSFKDDRLKAKFLDIIKDGSKKERIIGTIQDEKIKIELLKKLNDELSKASIIVSLKDEHVKLKLLEELNEDLAKACVIISLKNDEIKLKYIDSIKDESARAKIIHTLLDEDTKIEQLEKLNDESIKGTFICELNNDETKIEQLLKIKDEKIRTNIIISLKKDENKIELLDCLESEDAKTLVIRSLQSDILKKTQLKKLKNSLNIACVVGSFKNSYIINEQAEKISDSFVKEIVLGTIKNSEDEQSIVNRKRLRKICLDNNRKYKSIGLDSSITFGIEIETEGLLSLIIESLDTINVTNKNKKIYGWITDSEESVSNGVEVQSPILRDRKNDIEDIYIMCSMLQKCGQKCNEECGGHIHIGSDYLTSKEAYINLFELYGNVEAILYKICNEENTIPRFGINEYALPISSKINEALENGTINLEGEEDLDAFVNELQNVQEDRWHGLNLLNINNGKNTIEFRIPNGTINPDVWVENIKLFGRIIEVSQKVAEIEKQAELNSEDKRMLDIMDQIKKDLPEEEKMELLLELLFSEEEKDVYRKRYISCSELLKQLPDDKNPFNKVKFNPVDIKKKMHSVKEFHDLTINNRMGDIERETRQLFEKEKKSEEKSYDNYEDKK